MQYYDSRTSAFVRNQRASIPPPDAEPLLQKPVQLFTRNAANSRSIDNGNSRREPVKERTLMKKSSRRAPPVKSLRVYESKKFITVLPKIPSKQGSPRFHTSKKRQQKFNQDIRTVGLNTRDGDGYDSNIITKETLRDYQHP
jgi:hypothetical protein